MKKMMVLAVLAMAIATVSACYLPAADYQPQSRFSRAGAGFYGGVGFRRPMPPVLPANVGFLYRQPAYCDTENPLCVAIDNRTPQYHAACWIDGASVVPTLRGRVPLTLVRTADGAKPIGIIPPGTPMNSYWDTGEHTVRCVLMAGPVQVLPNSQMIYEPMWENTWRRVRVDTLWGRTLRLEDPAGGGWTRITRRFL